jgi:hypothetical protein
LSLDSACFFGQEASDILDSTVVRERTQMRRGVAACVLAAVVLVTGSSFGGAATAQAEKSAAARRASPQPRLVGTWRRLTTCRELVTALTKAGLKKWVLESVAGNGFIPGVTRPDQIVDPAHPCKGSVPRKHSHFFTKTRKFGSLDWRGRPVDDGTYRLVNPRTFVIFKEFPKVTFHYRIREQRIMFAPVINKGCASFRCAWAISMAYPGESWRRVR